MYEASVHRIKVSQLEYVENVLAIPLLGGSQVPGLCDGGDHHAELRGKWQGEARQLGQEAGKDSRTTSWTSGSSEADLTVPHWEVTGAETPRAHIDHWYPHSPGSQPEHPSPPLPTGHCSCTRPLPGSLHELFLGLPPLIKPSLPVAICLPAPTLQLCLVLFSLFADFHSDFGYFRPENDSKCEEQPELKGHDLEFCLYGREEHLTTNG